MYVTIPYFLRIEAATSLRIIKFVSSFTFKASTRSRAFRSIELAFTFTSCVGHNTGTTNSNAPDLLSPHPVWLIAIEPTSWRMFINGAEGSSLIFQTHSCLSVSKMRPSRTSQVALARLARRCDPRSAPTSLIADLPQAMVDLLYGLQTSAPLSRKRYLRLARLGLKVASLTQVKSWTPSCAP